MAAASQQVPGGFTESRVYGVSEDVINALVPQVLGRALQTEVKNPLPGCFTVYLEGMPPRELIVRVEPTPEGTRVRLDIRPWQDQRNALLIVFMAILVFPIFVYLFYALIKQLLSKKPPPQPQEVIAHALFRGLSQELSAGSGTGYRVAAADDRALAREEESEEEDQKSVAKA